MTTLSSFQAEQQNDQVLTTLNRDGSRRWLNPKPSRGRFLTGRRALAYFLIALFTLIPYLRMNGKPLVLLDVASRRFTLFGYTFLPTDTILLMLLMIMIFVTVFMVTAVLGRVWCGWACPQTVYMEFVYRPLERLLKGRKGPDGKVHPARKALKYIAYFVISMFLAHTFLAYFVGVERLAHWVQRSPIEHPSSFLIMAGVTVMMMFDFCFFREQMCIVACPYGRFQSVMLDRQSLVVGYDKKRGEPRGKKRKGGSAPAGSSGVSGARDISLRVLESGDGVAPGSESRATLGDCIDCHMCVHTCPTGIDIRNGLQMECIACTQCIDACDTVMDKIGRPRGLIRYSCQATLDGEPRRLIRPRLILYLLLLTVLGSLFGYLLVTKSPADFLVVRGAGAPFNQLAGGEISNQLKIKITNRTDAARRYEFTVLENGVRLDGLDGPVVVEAGALVTQPVLVILARDAFTSGHKDVRVRVTGDDGFVGEQVVRLLGPYSGAPVRHDDEKGHDKESEHDDEHGT